MEASTVDLRYRMKDILKALDRGESVKVFYRGKLRGVLVPPDQAEKKLFRTRDHPAFGMWADREDMKDVDAYVRNLRKGRFDDI